MAMRALLMDTMSNGEDGSLRGLSPSDWRELWDRLPSEIAQNMPLRFIGSDMRLCADCARRGEVHGPNLSGSDVCGACQGNVRVAVREGLVRIGMAKVSSAGTERERMQALRDVLTPPGKNPVMWIFGRSSHGLLGLRPESRMNDEPRPPMIELFDTAYVPISVASTDPWACVSVGDSHAAALTTDGELFTWGLSDRGQCGHGLDPYAVPHKPHRVAALEGRRLTACACGFEHTLAALEGGGLVAWGSNAFGELGTGPQRPRGSEGQADGSERGETSQYVAVPKAVRLMRGVNVRSVTCGHRHSLCIVEGGSVFAWGLNASGQLGTGDREMRSMPDAVDALWGYPVVQLVAGESHSAALTAHGRVMVWGRAKNGQLGLPRLAGPGRDPGSVRPGGGAGASQPGVSSWRAELKRKRFPLKPSRRLLSSLAQMGISPEAAERGLVETQNQGVEAALEWIYSNLGDPSPGAAAAAGGDDPDPTSQPARSAAAQLADVLLPAEVPGLSKVSFLASGSNHMVACCPSEPGGGAVYSWGQNREGQAGDFDTAADGSTFIPSPGVVRLPQRILALQGLGVRQAACGYTHTVAITPHGRVWGWGSAANGELGVKALADMACCPGYRDEPQPPVSLSDLWEGGMTLPAGFAAAAAAAVPGVASAFPVPIQCRAVYAGGSCTVVTQEPSTESLVYTSAQHNPWLKLEENLQRDLELLDASNPQDPKLQAVCTQVRDLFGSQECISALFLVKSDVILRDRDAVRPGGSRWQPYVPLGQSRPGPAGPGLGPAGAGLAPAPACAFDFLSLRKLFGQIVSQISSGPADCIGSEARAVVSALFEGLDALVSNMYGKKDVTTPERVCGLIVCLVAPWPLLEISRPGDGTLNGWTHSANTRIERWVLSLARACRQLPPDGMDILLGLLKTGDRGGDPGWVENMYQEFITNVLNDSMRAGSQRLPSIVEYAVELLGILEEANHLGGDVLGPEVFYNSVISENFEPADQYAKWMHNRTDQSKNETQLFSFLHYPFLLDSAAKREVLASEAYFTMAQTVHVSQLADGLGEGVARHMESMLQMAMPGLAPTGGMSINQTVAAAPRKAGNYASSQDRAARRRLDRTGSLHMPIPEECGIAATHPEACLVRCRRSHLVEDALFEVARQIRRDLLKPLKVHFIGEQGVDEGGVKKEFFQLFFDEVLSPDYGMFKVDSESRFLWFTGDSGEKYGGEQEEAFLLIGVMAGLAVYNQVILDLPFPGLLWNKLLGIECSFSDFMHAFPEQARSLTKVMEYDEADGSLEDVMCLDFTMDTRTVPGATHNVELKPGGADINVTKANRAEYVRLYVNFAVNKVCEQQFESFSKGFYMLCGGQALEIFRPQELENLVCGSPHLDFDALQRGAVYEGGYNKDSQVVKWFWQIVSELSIEDKKKVLKFFTGSDRSPIGGLEKMKCVIQRAGPDSMFLPTSHTCFNVLMLPDYTSRGKTRDRLLTAINNSCGFGLE